MPAGNAAVVYREELNGPGTGRSNLHPGGDSQSHLRQSNRAL